MSDSANRERNEHKDDAQQEGTEFWPSFWGYRLKITDTLIAAFTAVLAIFTFFLWWSTRSLVIGAENTAERQLRAYVFIDAIDFCIVPKPPANALNCTIKFKNFGQTPAYQFRPWSKTDVCATNPMRIPDPSITTYASIVVAPGDTHKIIVETPVSDDDIQALVDKKKVAFNCTRIDYVDAFDKKRCFEFYNKNGDRFPGAALAWEAEMLERPNKAK